MAVNAPMDYVLYSSAVTFVLCLITSGLGIWFGRWQRRHDYASGYLNGSLAAAQAAADIISRRVMVDGEAFLRLPALRREQWEDRPCATDDVATLEAEMRERLPTAEDKDE